MKIGDSRITTFKFQDVENKDPYDLDIDIQEISSRNYQKMDTDPCSMSCYKCTAQCQTGFSCTC